MIAMDSLDRDPLTAQAGNFLTDALATPQQRLAETERVVNHNQVHISCAEDADGLSVGENREPADRADLEFASVSAHLLEQLWREHADRGLIQMRRQLAGEEQPVRSCQHAA